jgi:hypothetical protein
MKLSKEILDELIYELEKTPLVNEQEWKKRIRFNDAFRRIIKFDDYSDTTTVHYSFRNENLNKILTKISKRDIKDALTLHTVEAQPPQTSIEHTDKASYLTLNILLEDNFEGGYLYINGKKINDYKNRGDYIMYNGCEEPHSVSPIIKGKRKSLIVWYGKNKQAI